MAATVTGNPAHSVMSPVNETPAQDKNLLFKPFFDN